MRPALDRRRFGAAALAAVALAGWSAGPAAAQAVYTPPRGAPERAAILDAVRAAVGEGLQIQRPGLVVTHLGVLDGAFAYAIVQPLTPDGAPVDYAATPFAAAWAAGGHQDVARVFLSAAGGGGWSVAEVDFGSTDPVGAAWAAAHGAPQALFDAP